MKIPLFKRIENLFSFLYAAEPGDTCHFDHDFLHEVKAAALRGAEQCGPNWLDPTDKPPHLPGEHHSQNVLLLMKKRGGMWEEERIRIGHVSCGHWRPSGGNGNFDDDVEGWMPLPPTPSPQGETQ